MSSNIRTDLAVESEALEQQSSPVAADSLPGVSVETRQQQGFSLTTVRITDAQGEAAVGKPRGTYITVDLDALIRREENAFPAACEVVSSAIRSLLKLEENGNYLVVGLGNREITPDAVGPETIDYVMVTRHLKEQLPAEFGPFRPVSAVCSGVLGTTGIESGALVRAIADKLRPTAVIAVDALASRTPERLCRTIQIADTGIVPGSGVGNARLALNRETLGIPVLAIGVPTVVDAATLTLDLAAKSGASPDPARFGKAGEMIVTPREIDKNVRDVSKLIGYALNLALHDGLTITDIDMFLS